MSILGGLITTAVFAAVILVFDWRIGLISLVGILLYLLAVSAMEKKSAVIADDTQKSQTALIEAVLETVQGMSVVKSFNLTGKGDKKLRDALEYNRRANVDVTNILTPYTALEEGILQVASVAMMLTAILLCIGGKMTLPNALMTVVMSFLVFNQIKAFGMGVSMIRLTAAAIDRTVETEDMPRMDENGKAISPAKHDIVFDHVNFSYEKRQILHDVSAVIPDKSTTAVIGPSGSGKATFCNLISRFWDVDSGSVKIGGVDVRDYTLESLMSQISVVFQDVYLFADTIENNIKFGCLKDDKFCEKMNDYILFKNLDGKYLTLPECLEIKPQDEEENKENAVDENGNKVEAEVVEDKAEDEASEENTEEEKKEKIIYYVTDEQQQSQYINMFKAAKMDAVILTHNIDQPFISQLEQKNEGIKFQRIDADVTDALKSKTSKKAEKEMEEQAESISKLMKKALKNDKITIKVEKLKNKKISSMITLSEESRRMQDMMKMYSMPGMDMSAFGGEGETLILNANHPLVQYITEHQDGENAEMICEQLYDLAKLQHAPLSADAMTKFVARSNDIMMLLTK